VPHTHADTTLAVEPRPEPLVLGRYDDRTIIAIHDAGDGTLLIDKVTDGSDPRLVGRIDPDEPDGNAQLLAELYLADPTRGRCRRVTDDDFQATVHEPVLSDVRWDLALPAEIGEALQLQAVPVEGSIPAARWTRTNGAGVRDVVSVRDVIGQLEDYEPALTFTEAAVRHHEQADISTILLRGELKRMHASSIVLNRRLREHVQQAVAGGLTMSEIAIRCGRVKHDEHGRVSGDTSWLARRIGQLPAAGEGTPTPWVHSDVLALVARDGLGVAPREVEVS